MVSTSLRLFISQHRGYKTLVDFKLFCRKNAQHQQVGIARAKIINRDGDPRMVKGVEQFDAAVEIFSAVLSVTSGISLEGDRLYLSSMDDTM